MRKLVEVPTLKNSEILFAYTSDQDYSMDRTIVSDSMHLGDADEEEFVVIMGGHCSCFGFDETQWESMAYTKEELKTLVLGNSYSIPKPVREQLKHYFNW